MYTNVFYHITKQTIYYREKKYVNEIYTVFNVKKKYVHNIYKCFLPYTQVF